MRTDQPFHSVCQPGSPSDVRARKPPSWATPRRKARLLPKHSAGLWSLAARTLRAAAGASAGAVPSRRAASRSVRRRTATMASAPSSGTSLPVVQQPRNPQSESIARSLYEPALFGPAPRFPRFVKLLHDPPPGVSGDNLERLIEALNRTRRQQQPLEPVVPDPHTPDPDRRAPPPGTVAG